MVPEGAKWLSSIANRSFKTKVIELVLWRLPHLLLAKHPAKTLIVDFRATTKYTWDLASSSVREEEIDLPAMGEADVKFVRYADMFGKLLVDSIDGDSVPIALVHHERLLNQVRVYYVKTKARFITSKQAYCKAQWQVTRRSLTPMKPTRCLMTRSNSSW